MKNNKGFTLIELLAVIVILAIVTVIGVTTILPYMANARKDAFNIEATDIVKGAKDAIGLDALGKISLKPTEKKSYHNGNEYCFTVQELSDLGIYDGDASLYSGKVIANVNNKDYAFTLYLKKGNEFKIIGGAREDYKGFNSFSSGNWETSYEECSAS